MKNISSKDANCEKDNCKPSSNLYPKIFSGLERPCALSPNYNFYLSLVQKMTQVFVIAA
jgi:hypothetical protein